MPEEFWFDLFKAMCASFCPVLVPYVSPKEVLHEHSPKEHETVDIYRAYMTQYNCGSRNAGPDWEMDLPAFPFQRSEVYYYTPAMLARSSTNASLA